MRNQLAIQTQSKYYVWNYGHFKYYILPNSFPVGVISLPMSPHHREIYMINNQMVH
jgi:hypothetical protein